MTPFLIPSKRVRSRIQPSWVIGITLLSLVTADAVEGDHAEKMKAGLALFDEEIAPMLKEHCVRCHGGEKVKGDLDFATRVGLLQGGSHGPAVRLGEGKESFLYQVTSHQKEPYMPDTGEPLSTEQTDAIARWIDLGAPYSDPLVENPREIDNPSVVTEADREFWSFRRLPEAFPSEAGVDFYVEAKLHEAGLDLAESADRVALINRVSLGLTGLPPTPEEVDAFVNDNSLEAWTKVIDRLLASPHYGERWARHWMDLARYADSGGFEHDNDRPHAWPYRDFLIRAFNENLPYNQFVQWQLAGDELAPEKAMAWQATGFLTAGVKNGQITEREGMPERYDVLDDMVNTTGNAFLALSLSCARCHDHKFDPIPTRDYYGMVAAFASTTARNRPIPLKVTGTDEQKIDQFHADRAAAEQALADYNPQKRTLTEPKSYWLAAKPVKVTASLSPKIDHEDPEQRPNATVEQLDETTWELASVNGGFGGFQYEFVVDGSLDVRGVAFEILPHPENPLRAVGMEDNGRFGTSQIKVRESTPLKSGWSNARNVSVTSGSATVDASTYERLYVAGKNGKTAPTWMPRPADSLDRITLGVEWEKLAEAEERRLFITLPARSQGGTGRQGFRKVRVKLQIGPEQPDLNLPAVGVPERFRFAKPEWQALAKKAHALADKLPPVPTQTSFVATEGGIPARLRSQSLDYWEQAHVLRRGAVHNRDGEAVPGFIQAVSLPDQHQLESWHEETPHGTSGQRAAMARWMTDLESGAGHLVARVMVNRLWQHHFEQGLVATPSDFGSQGTAPTHPKLLDWLAVQFIESGWDIKAMHRLILNSRTYQQSAALEDAAIAVDPTNQLLWRYPPHRLEAETIRDRMLAASGLLDPTLYGAGILDESMTRRSLYFKVKRSRLIPSMVQLNWPDTLASLDKRAVTTVAPQALLMMNNPEVRRYAEALAARVSSEKPTLPEQIDRAYRLTVGRVPTDQESRVALSFVESQAASNGGDGDAALADFCQILFSLNEFFFHI